MILGLTFAVLVCSLTLVFWGTTRFFQSYLYSEPADKLPLRSLIAGLVVGGYMTFWSFVNARSETDSKYGTFFDFNPVGAKDISSFEAVRRYPILDQFGKLTAESREETTTFTRKPGGKNPEFFDEAGNKYELLSNRDKQFLTVALLVELDNRKVRFNARIDPKNPNRLVATGDVGDRQFDEDKGTRHLDGGAPVTVFAPSTGAVIAALGLNGLLFVAWFVAFWPVLRYGSGHALGLALAFGVVVLLVLMPLLFKTTRPKASSTAPLVAAPQ